MGGTLPYRIAVLCYLFDRDGRVLLLHRRNPPNQELHSPVGGKLEMDEGESPTSCAVREIFEEVGLRVAPKELHLTGIISEAGYEDQTHWLIFLYELTHPVHVEPTVIREGQLEWHDPESLGTLAIPRTDQEVLWPLFWRYRRRFFMAHLHCHDGLLRWTIQQPPEDAP